MKVSFNVLFSHLYTFREVSKMSKDLPILKFVVFLLLSCRSCKQIDV